MSARAHTPELATTPLKSPALYLSKGTGSSSRSLPLAATTTKLHITSNAKSPISGSAENGATPKRERDPSPNVKVHNDFKKVPEADTSEDPTPTKPSKDRESRPELDAQACEVPKATNESVGWLNWFSKSEIAKEEERSLAGPEGEVGSVDQNRPQADVTEALQDTAKQRRNSEPTPASQSGRQEEAPRSWLRLWGNTSSQVKSSSSASALGRASNPQRDSNGTESQNGKLVDSGFDSMSTPQPSQQPIDSTRSSYGWAFWSRDQEKPGDEKRNPGSEVGELALAGSSSQSKPEGAVVDYAKGLPNKIGRRQRPQSLEIAVGPKMPHGTEDDAKRDPKLEITDLASVSKPHVDADSKAKRIPENLLLPSFRSTYSTVERPSLIQQLTRLLQMSSSSESKHLNIIHSQPRIKRALAIVSLANHRPRDHS